jgi:hypothetical protein
MSSLHIDPELGRRAEIARQPQRRVGGNRALTFDNSGDSVVLAPRSRTDTLGCLSNILVNRKHSSEARHL